MVEYGSVLDGYIVPGEPLVSVKVTAYNHGKYIRQCLDGILMQKVNFPYEVLVHDDASPDDTADIIREYEARFPTVIKPIYQTENQYSKHDGTIGRIQNERAKGKYIAQCEGDDYWTNPGKLQMQVDFLEGHEEYVGTAHNVRTIDENYDVLDEKKHCYPYRVSHTQTLDKNKILCLEGQTASLVYRNIFSGMEKETIERYFACTINGDQKLTLLLLLNGDIYYFENVMAAHRKIVSEGTSWSARTYGKNLLHDNLLKMKDLQEFAKDRYGVELSNNDIYGCVYSSFIQILRHPSLQNIDIFAKVCRDTPCKGDAGRYYLKQIPRVLKNMMK